MRTLNQRIMALVIATFLVVVGGLCSPTFAAHVGGGTLDPLNVPKYVTPLVIPPVMPESPAGFNAAPQADHDIAVRQFKQQILPGGIWNTVTGGSNSYLPTTVWSYGSASDPMPDSSALGGGLGVAPAPNSSFNYPAFTVENISNAVNPKTVRWINELVQDPVNCFYGNATGNSCNYLPHLLPVDQTLHWANPSNADCIDHLNPYGPTHSGTDCETLNQLPYMGPVPIVTHVHGAHVNPESDGYPEAWWLANADDIPGTYATEGLRYGEWMGNGPNGVAGSAYFAYENDQEATTIWYHDHSMGMTRLNVYAGPAGFWLIRNAGGDVVNDFSTGLAGSLPGPAPVAGDSVLDLNTYYHAQDNPTSIRKDIREIPVVMQDRSFDWVDATGNPVPEGDPSAAATALWYPTSRTDFDGFAGPYLGDPLGSGSDINSIWNPEAFFNTMVVNGVTWPKLEVATEQYRFRLLNGCNSRTLNLAMFVVTAGPDTVFGTADDVLGAEVPFYQIGGDQGFLPAVTQISTGFMAPLAADGSFPIAGDNQQTEAIQGLLMMPAERADVIVDFAGLTNGTHVRIINTAGDGPFGGLDPADVADPVTTGQVMDFVVNSTLNQVGGDLSTAVENLILPADTPLGVADNAASPRRLSLNEMISETVCYTITDPITGAYQLLYTEAPGGTVDEAVCQAAADAWGAINVVGYTNGDLTGETAGPRQALLGSITDASGTGAGPFTADPERWMLEPPTTQVALGDTEVWELFNTTMDAHPIHVHLVRFEIVDREDISIDEVTGAMAYLGTNNDHPVLPNELGFKDTVVAYPGQVTRLKAKFDILGRYVWHCHIVEHEDNEMMLPFDVVASIPAPASIIVPSSSSTGNYDVTWTAVAGASSYTLQESTDPSFQTAVTETQNAKRPIVVSGKVNGTYYYRVRAEAPPSSSGWTSASCVVYSPVSSVSLTANPSASVQDGASVSVLATPVGGTMVQYQLWTFAFDGTRVYELVTDWQNSPSFTWDTSTAQGPGKYNLQVRARSLGSTAAADAVATHTINVVAAVTPVTGVSLVVSPAASAPVNSAVSIIATPTPAGSTAQYQLWTFAFDGTRVYELVSDWQNSPNFTWDTSAAQGPGKYNIQVRARAIGSTAAYEAMVLHTINLTADVTPVSSVSIAVTPAASAPDGSSVSIAATPVGGGTTVQYQLWTFAFDGTRVYELVSDWQNSPNFSWDTTGAQGPGKYNIRVRARTLGSTAAYEAQVLHTIFLN